MTHKNNFKTYLAPKSLCTTFLCSKYLIPEAICVAMNIKQPKLKYYKTNLFCHFLREKFGCCIRKSENSKHTWVFGGCLVWVWRCCPGRATSAAAKARSWTAGSAPGRQAQGTRAPSSGAARRWRRRACAPRCCPATTRESGFHAASSRWWRRRRRCSPWRPPMGRQHPLPQDYQLHIK